jgi:hypothetical protein
MGGADPSRIGGGNLADIQKMEQELMFKKILIANRLVIASKAKQSRPFGVGLDCRVAALLAMTETGVHNV